MDWLDKLKQHTIYKQFVPTDEDLNNDELKKLAERLKAETQAKTLINILEWQDRNIKYWDERAITSVILSFLVISSFSILSFIGINPLVYLLLLLFIPILFFGNITLNIALDLIAFFLVILLIPISVALTSPNLSVSSNMLLFFIAISFILGALISLILELIFKYTYIKRLVPEFKIDDTFELSLSIEKILKYRLSICRDYAKLTSALLLKIYPKKEIYFALIPKHVAVVINLDNRFFVIDQKLPILPLYKWQEKWRRRLNKNNLKIKLIRIYLENEKVKIRTVRHEKISYRDVDIAELNKLEYEIKKSLSLAKNRKRKSKTRSSIEIILHDMIPLLNKDDIFRFSLIRLIRNRIEKELVGNISKLDDLEIVPSGDNLVVRVWLS